MRRLAVFTIALVAFGAFSVAPAPAATPACGKIGTKGNDFLAGTKGADIICGLGGRDYIAGKKGNDRLRGGPGNDTLVANAGVDRLIGGAGKDQLFAVDKRGGDVLVGGKGRDRCYKDPGDRTMGCEVVRTSVNDKSTTVIVASETSTTSAITYGETVQDCFQADPACPPPNRP